MQVRMKEKWKPVVGYEGRYEVSNNGRIRRGEIPSRIRRSKKIINSQIDQYGYSVVDLWRDGKYKRSRVHVLLMRAFVGKRTAIDTRHLDGNKSNNNLSNLKYGTRSENMIDDYKHNPNRGCGFRNKESHRRAIKNRYQPKGERHGCAKLTEEQVEEIRNHPKVYGYCVKLANKLNVHRVTICIIANNKSWRV